MEAPIEYDSTDSLPSTNLSTSLTFSNYDHMLQSNELYDIDHSSELTPIPTQWSQSDYALGSFDNISMDQDYTGHNMDLPFSLLVTFTVTLLSLLVTGVVGNILVILVLIRSQWRERRSLILTTSTTNAYILHLSAADLLFLVFCAPFQGTVYILNHWPYGWLMCKLAHYCQFCTVYASVWILTTMSVDRYVAIGHPLKSVQWRRPTQATRLSLCMWLAAAVVSIPWLILYETDEYETEDGFTRVACYDAWPDSMYKYRKWMILFGFLIGFLIPSIIIFFMALLIAKSIRLATHQPLLANMKDGSENGNTRNIKNSGGLRRRKRVGWLVFTLSLVFFICWAPHNFSLLWLNFDSNALDWITDHYQVFFIIKLAAHMVTYLNSSVNPLLYSVGSNHLFRRLAITLGFKRWVPTAAIDHNCRAFANRTLHVGSVLIQFPLSPSTSSGTGYTRKISSRISLTQTGYPATSSTVKTALVATALNLRRSPVIALPALVTVKACQTQIRLQQPKQTCRRTSSAGAVLMKNNELEIMRALPMITRRLEEVKRMM